MHHSDRGSQYASHAFQDKLKEFGMICSMSRKGNCWDNAPTESWFNSFKNERYHDGVRYATHAEMKAASFGHIEVFYNRTRQHSTLAYYSPIQYLDRWRCEQNQKKLAAWNSPDGRLIIEGTSVLQNSSISSSLIWYKLLFFIL